MWKKFSCLCCNYGKPQSKCFLHERNSVHIPYLFEDKSLNEEKKSPFIKIILFSMFISNWFRSCSRHLYSRLNNPPTLTQYPTYTLHLYNISTNYATRPHTSTQIGGDTAVCAIHQYIGSNTIQTGKGAGFPRDCQSVGF